MTARLAVLGNPVEHSRSPDIHREFGKQAGIELSYEKLLVPDGAFRSVADEFLASGTGFNVTVPCKHDALTYVDTLSEEARLGDAVNTVSRLPDGSLLGSNTDGTGLIADLTGNLGWAVRGKRLLVLGAGGAVSGVLPALILEEPDAVHLYNRTPDKAEALARRQPGRVVSAVRTESLEDAYDLVINGTSASLNGRMPTLPVSVLSPETRCYDMVYSPTATAFNSWCHRTAGCEVADGLGMLVEQAARSFEIWFSRPVDTAPVLAGLRRQLSGA